MFWNFTNPPMYRIEEILADIWSRRITLEGRLVYRVGNAS